MHHNRPITAILASQLYTASDGIEDVARLAGELAHIEQELAEELARIEAHLDASSLVDAHEDESFVREIRCTLAEVRLALLWLAWLASVRSTSAQARSLAPPVTVDPPLAVIPMSGAATCLAPPVLALEISKLAA